MFTNQQMLDLITNGYLPKILSSLLNLIQVEALDEKNIDSINIIFKLVQSISIGIQKKF